MRNNYLILILVFLVMLGGCSLPFQANETPASETTETAEPKKTAEDEPPAPDTLPRASSVSDKKIKEIQSLCSGMSLLYKDIYESANKGLSHTKDGETVIDQASIDKIEDVLIDAGYPVMNSEINYPSYLENADGIYVFWESVKSRKDDETAFWSVSSSGGLFYRAFQFLNEKAYSIIASTTWNENGELELTYAEQLEVLNWDMTYNDDFYYQDLPADWHWDASALLRLKPADKTLYDMNAKYIMPVGYHNANIFLCDWNTSDFGDLCFNDLFEYLYKLGNGRFAYASDYEYEDEPYGHSCIPAETFEGTILPYFDISLSDFRAKTLYNAEKNIYPWQELSPSNVMYFASLIPEVTGTKKNGDGSITLTVNVMCLDEKTDCLFIHEVTIKELDNGKFQYLGNRITYTGENKLPSSRPRIPAQRASSPEDAN